jgi:class 3 adenylate cyclase
MEGLTDFEAPSRRLPEGREQPWRESSEPASQLRMAWRTSSRPRMQRKLAAVVAADVAGYSLLMGRDEEGALRRLLEFHAAIEPIVEADGGRLVNTAGDAMLLEFSSGVAALECALAIQEVVSLLNRGLCDADKMLFRIGVNLGDVIVAGGDLFGEAVNVASRLEAIAEPGGICVSHSCYLQTRRRLDVDFIDLGEQRLKNIAEPVRAYDVRRPLPAGLAEAVRPRSTASAFFPFVLAPPSAVQDPIAAQPARDPTNRDAVAAGAIVENVDGRQVDSAKVLPWPGRRRSS